VLRLFSVWIGTVWAERTLVARSARAALSVTPLQDINSKHGKRNLKPHTL
jgi:hypothetical protein